MTKQSEVCGIILINDKRQCLMVHQVKSGVWGIPKGHVNNNESIYDCAIREFSEETGLYIPYHGFKRCGYISTIFGHAFVFRTPPDFKWDFNPIDKVEIDNVMWINLSTVLNVPLNCFSKMNLIKYINNTSNKSTYFQFKTRPIISNNWRNWANVAT